MPRSDATDATRAVVLVAHGSRRDAANAAHREVAADLASRLELPTIAAFLEFGRPDVESAINTAALVADRILILPYFLLPGRHTQRDLPYLVESAARRHPTRQLVLLDHLGAAPGLVDLLARLIDLSA